ncbi:ground-like domain protein, partial [Ancylostoma caninum]
DEEEEEEKGDEEEEAKAKPPKVGGDNHDIRTGNLTASLKDAPNAKYYYPPKVMVPLPSCFYNPSGYVCCNLQLNNLIEDTFEEIKNVQGYSACNIAKVANIIQQKSEQMFEHPFESIVALSDFAQNVHFAGDLVCKVEIDGKYMLTYATPYDAEHAVEAVGVAETPAPEVNEMRGKDGKRKAKKPNKAKKKSLPIHNFRM